jgi:hypothetical protein
VAVEVKQGTSAFSVLTHQNNQRSWDWGVHNHVVTVPEDGQLRITLNWGAEANQEVPVATVEGAGLPEPIIFPKIENRSTIGQEIEGGVRWSLEMLKQLRDVISKARSPLEEMAMRRTGNRDAARRTIDEMLHVPEMDLLTCDKLDPERFRLSDEDLQMALSEGYFPMHEKILKNKYAISEKALEVSQLLLYIIRSQDKSTVDDLIAQAKKLIGLSAGHSECMPYAQQMAKWLHRLEIGSNTTGDAAAAATSLGALADALFERRLIDVSEHENSNRICWRFQIGE